MQHFTETTWFREFVKTWEGWGYTVQTSEPSETQAYIVLQKSSFGKVYADRIKFNGTERGLNAAMCKYFGLTDMFLM